MTLLALGLILWSAAHLFKRAAPDARAKLGDRGKGLVALLVLGSVVMMVIGYRSADATAIWGFGGWALSVNNLLMVFAVVLLGIGNSKSRLRGKLRHPMLAGLILWSVAHLLVNGDLPSLVLFGWLGVWAVVTIRLINRAEPAPEPYTDGTLQGDVRLALISIVVFAVIVGIHMWLGYRPFPG